MTESRALFAQLMRLIVQLLILWIINLVLIELPMLKSLSISGVPFTIPAVISFVIGIVMISMLLVFRQDFVPVLNRRLPGSPQASVLASSAIILGIIIIAYGMSEGLIRPLLFQFGWVYPLAFLLAALWPLYVLTTTLYACGRPIADWATEKIAGSPTGRSNEAIKCTSCNNACESGTRYCPACGACLVPHTESTAVCKSCGMTNKPSYKYCVNCGAPVEDEQCQTRVSI